MAYFNVGDWGALGTGFFRPSVQSSRWLPPSSTIGPIRQPCPSHERHARNAWRPGRKMLVGVRAWARGQQGAGRQMERSGTRSATAAESATARPDYRTQSGGGRGGWIEGDVLSTVWIGHSLGPGAVPPRMRSRVCGPHCCRRRLSGRCPATRRGPNAVIVALAARSKRPVMRGEAASVA
jgi:hypothetical protein